MEIPAQFGVLSQVFTRDHHGKRVKMCDNHYDSRISVFITPTREFDGPAELRQQHVMMLRTSPEKPSPYFLTSLSLRSNLYSGSGCTLVY